MKKNLLKQELSLHRSLLAAMAKGLKECTIELETERNKNRLLLQQKTDVISQAKLQTSVIADQEKTINDLKQTIEDICKIKIDLFGNGKITIGDIVSKLKTSNNE